MNSYNGLLINLRSYRPREDRDSLENFVTEVFRWLLENIQGFSGDFLDLVNLRLGQERELEWSDGPVVWQSQFSLGTKRPDMVAAAGSNLLVFEHKVWSPASSQQLANYRKLAAKDYPQHDTRVVQIVPHPAEFRPEADCCLCWSDVYSCVEGLLHRGELSDFEIAYLKDFLELLDFEGLGPPSPVNIVGLRYFNEAANVEQQLQKLYTALLQGGRLRDLSGYEQAIGYSQWGRVGILWNRRDAHEKWAPAIGLCTVINGKDHCITHRMTGNDPLKLQVILSFSKSLHRARRALVTEYGQLKNKMAQLAGKYGWNFYDHLEDSSATSRNAYHQLYLEAPLHEIFRGTKDFESQLNAIRDAALPLVEELANSEELRNLQRSLDAVGFVEDSI